MELQCVDGCPFRKRGGCDGSEAAKAECAPLVFARDIPDEDEFAPGDPADSYTANWLPPGWRWIDGPPVR